MSVMFVVERFHVLDLGLTDEVWHLRLGGIVLIVHSVVTFFVRSHKLS